MRFASILLWTLVLSGFISGFLGCGGGGEDGEEEILEWLFMVYMGGDNNLSSMALDDINEMEMIGSKSGIGIVVQAEFNRQYSPGLPSYNTLRFYIEKDSDPNSVTSDYTDIGNKNMADPATLTDFIAWATAKYPANRYALVIWDHGAGWKERATACVRGAVADDTSGDFMSLPDLANGVGNAGVHLDFINFDACLMGMYEVAYEFKGLCDIMAFSEESEPGDGDPYNTILASLTANSVMSAADLGKTTVQKFFDSYNNQRSSITKSAVDVRLVEDLHTKVLNLGSVLTSRLDISRTFIEASQMYSQNYAYPFCRDLGHLCSLLAGSTDSLIVSAAEDLLSFISNDQFIIANAYYSGESGGDRGGVDNSTGISIYFPTTREATNADLNEYSKLAVSQGAGTWQDFLLAFLAGESQPSAPGYFMFILTWDTDSDVDLYVIEPDGTVASPWMGSTSPNGFLSGDSADTGISREVYSSADWVMPGEYWIMANYWTDGTYDYANALLEYVDFYYHEDQTLGPRRLSLDNPLPPDVPIDDAHSDWWIVGYLVREAEGGAKLYPADPGKYPVELGFDREKVNKKRKISPNDFPDEGQEL